MRAFFWSITRLLQLSFLGVLCFTAWRGEWLHVYLALQALVISLVPTYMTWRLRVPVPAVVHAGIAAFLFVSLVLGKMAGFYDRFLWWDLLLHAYAGAGTTLIALILIDHYFAIRHLSLVTAAAVGAAFSVSLAIAVLWELFEFSMDVFVHGRPQMQPSNVDTMLDLTVATAGAAAVSFLSASCFYRWSLTSAKRNA